MGAGPRLNTHRQRRALPDIYGPALLAGSDWYVLGLMTHLVWRCPARTMLAQYGAHVSSHHLEVGVGTGYFLDHCRFPGATPNLVLLDLNPGPLRWAARRLRRYRPRVYRANVLEPIDLGGERFDSIGLNYVLHCLPGDCSLKSAALGHLRALLRLGGVLFGCTMLGRGVSRNLLARGCMAAFNRFGIFANTEDDLEGLERALAAHFRTAQVRTVGCAALFVAHA